MGDTRRRGPAPPSTRSNPKKRDFPVEGALWVVGGLLVGWPLLRDATSDEMRRNTYSNQASCECAYSSTQCKREGGSWVGPWYAVDEDDREAGDPGEGRRCGSSGGSGHASAFASRGGDDVRGRTGVQQGHRGGFGGTGRVRAGGS
jgi:hypothetical protein